ncbi:phage antirepressor N-terminal domain-containing protein [Pseudomonas sp. P5_152]|uniref:phage antirepressor N-terminal domain-containing protein n=1 Tax=Pseudomonas sp. P5_152 TaxID=3043442 RepID=UPI002A35AECD|nr:phage antirepressor N-terminal domain-containing protein [Pseudomonas sp. P5_152]MDX9664257.1 phage antirepressor N-terminal domain-containing protein [Pseudomonas sp. P5_152]
MQGQLMPVQFYEDTLVLVDQDKKPFVVMKPLVSNMGLVWSAQFVKTAEKFGAVVSEIETTGADGKQYRMTCLPLRKLPAWLFSINPNKVKPELRDKIIRYQEECDDVLWNYWTTGTAAQAGSGSPNVTQQIALSRHRIALFKELQRSRNHVIRATIQEEITQLSAKLGLSVPDLDNIEIADPLEKDILADFWAALRHLDGKGVRYNHAKKSTLLAIRIDELAAQFEAHGITIKLDSAITNALENSSSPKYVDHSQTVHNELKRCGIKCWVFESLPVPVDLSFGHGNHC